MLRRALGQRRHSSDAARKAKPSDFWTCGSHMTEKQLLVLCAASQLVTATRKIFGAAG